MMYSLMDHWLFKMSSVSLSVWLNFLVMYGLMGHWLINVSSVSLSATHIIVSSISVTFRSMASHPCIMIISDIYRALHLFTVIDWCSLSGARLKVGIGWSMVLRVSHRLLAHLLLMLLVFVLLVALMLCHQDVVMIVTLLRHLTFSSLVSISWFGLNGHNLCWDVVLAMVKLLRLVNLHFQDQMA